MKFSVIIPVGEKSDYIGECVNKILKQSFKDFEIIVLPDKKTNKLKEFKSKKIKIIETGKINPAYKRDLGVKKSKGEIIAFIDDDAYPDKDWMKNALKSFKDKKIIALGGPGLNPKKDSLKQKIGGKILESKFASGTEDYRCKIKEKRKVDDYPTFNFFVRKKGFEKVGGFNYQYWRGEDTKLCLELIKHGDIIYDPEVVVYHHKRALFKPHLKQIWKCALYRGFFARKFPKTSRRIAYFVPSLFLIGLIVGFILSFLHNLFLIVYIDVLIIYFGLLILETIKIKKGKILFMCGVFLTHLVYGYAFLTGFFKKNIK